MPQAGVPRVEASAIGAVEFGMEALSGLDGAPAAKTCLEPLVEQYRGWIATQGQNAPAFTGRRRREVVEELVRRAGIDRLCTRPIGGGTVRPKVIASPATVRLAQKQI